MDIFILVFCICGLLFCIGWMTIDKKNNPEKYEGKGPILYILFGDFFKGIFEPTPKRKDPKHMNSIEDTIKANTELHKQSMEKLLNNAGNSKE